MKTSITRVFCTLLLVLTLMPSVFAQYWENAGVPVFTPAPTLVFTDTVHDWLITSGQNQISIDDEHYYIPLMRYNGDQWDTLGLFGHQIRTAVVYHDTLIVGGVFQTVHDEPISRIACYVNGEWQPYGDFNCGIEAAQIERLRIVDGELYAMGIFCYADGQLCNGLAKRVGGYWEPLPGWPDISFLGDPRLIDIIRFQGKLVVAGVFHSTDLTLGTMLQFDGTAWVPVCANCLNGGYDGVGSLAEYQGELYAGGIFYYGSGNAGQGIMRWDGEQWFPVGTVGDGIQLDNYSDQYSPDIEDLKVRDGLLYIGGGYNYVDHVATPAGICTWDGTGFCLLQGNYFSDNYSPFDFYHDTLYGGTGPGVTDPALRGVIRYLGELCSTNVRVEEVHDEAKPLQVSWSSAGELVIVGLTDGPHQLRVYVAQGRLVLNQQVQSMSGRSESVRLKDQGSALYLVVVDNERTVRIVPPF